MEMRSTYSAVTLMGAAKASAIAFMASTTGRNLGSTAFALARVWSLPSLIAVREPLALGNKRRECLAVSKHLPFSWFQLG